MRISRPNLQKLNLHHKNKKKKPYEHTPSSAGIAQSVQRLAMDWTVWGSNPGWGEIFRTRLDQPWGPPSFLYNGYRVFLGGKAAGVWC